MSDSFQTPAPSHVVPNMKPLLFDGGDLYCSRFDKIYKTSDCGRSFEAVGRLDLKLPYRPVVRYSKFLQRLARAQVYRMRVLPDGGRIYVFRGGIYTQREGADVAERSFSVDRGSRPTSLAMTADGFTVFGEYWSNPSRDAVRIFGSDDGGQSWRVTYSFDAGAVRHVHGISYDRFEDCFWICTGDYDDECRLLRASLDFSHLEVVRRGGQAHRFYYLTVAKDVLLTTTDSPLEPNQVCLYHKAADRLDRVADIENSSFHSCLLGRRAFVSTNAEASPCHDDRASYIWTGSLDHGGWHHYAGYEVDLPYRVSQSRFLPDGLFQFSQVFFPEGDNPTNKLICHGIGVQPYGYAMLCFDQEALQMPLAA